MRAPAIPQRIPPLSWRKPAFVWTPLALALAIGGPAAAFFDEPSMRQAVLMAGAAVFAVALTTLAASWLLGRPPKARREVVSSIVTAGALASVAAPFALSELLAGAAERPEAAPVTFAMALSLMPLALLIGLPMALVSGLIFAWTALTQAPLREGAGDLLDDVVFRHDVQPFK